MNTFKIPSAQGAKTISLYNLLNEMLGCYKPVRKARRNFFINEVSPKLSISADNTMLAQVRDNLFAIISSNPGNTCVRISAQRYENEVALYMRTSEIMGFCCSGIRRHAA